MTDYENHMELGLYREETDVVAGTNIVLSFSIATNCHPFFRNKPLGIGYVLGIEDIEVTVGAHAGAHLNAHVVSASGGDQKIIVLDANTWDTETVVVRFYASGYDILPATSTISRLTDKIRAEHPDGILTAYNQKGHVNPLEAGMVFDNAMGSNDAVTITAGETTVLEYDMSDGSSTGTWSFSGNRPYYVTCVRVEAKESDMDTTKGVKVHIYEDGTEIGEQGGAGGIVVNDTDNWLTSEFVDGADTWFSANIFLGMMLCSDFKVTVETNGGNGDLENFHTFVMGWYVPDSLTVSGVKESFTYHSVPAPCGLYMEKIYTVDSNISIDTDPRYLPEMDVSLRTAPHARNEYRYGVEYVKNLTTDEFITSGIKEVSDTAIYFDPSGASENDIVEVGYYGYDSLGAVYGLTPKAGDLLRSTDIDGLIRASDRMDRVDFGKADFSYGNTNHEYVWHHEMFAKYSVWGDYFGPSSVVNSAWQNLISFDPYNYVSRNLTRRHSDYLSRSTSLVDETPFFVTGFLFTCEKTAITGGNKYANGIKFKISFHSGSDSVRQHNQSEIIYYPLASTAGTGLGEPVPGAMGGAHIITTNNVDGPMFFVPLGMIRCYSFSVDVAVEPGEAFESFNQKLVQLQGWMIEAS
jgi:hypothetical protein